MKRKNCNRKCDNCKHYQWYYDLCSKYDCKVDDRSVCADYEPKEDSWGRRIVSVNLKVENIYKHKSDFSDIDDGFENEEIEDSWESVSK